MPLASTEERAVMYFHIIIQIKEVSHVSSEVLIRSKKLPSGYRIARKGKWKRMSVPYCFPDNFYEGIDGIIKSR